MHSELMADQGVIVVRETSGEAYPQDQMVLELYGEMFSQDFTYEVGVPYPVDDPDPVSCMECLTIGVNCPVGTASTGSCEVNYAAVAGEFTITEMDTEAGVFKATLTGAQFVNVDDENSGWCVDSFDFNEMPAPAPAE
ncbi:hypothetical protein DN745_05920 [Bradymonas sediminis]|uniref:Uncharacterized protein n=2 Tax=Bradymonas sediminis TaxID=1548548 RepID=A0A2Z4FJ85_9DELT|nr:hypothetical protein DN745_05920 [Bradymonas sediminis]